jgi:trimeric autotransporter adhesin
MARHRSLRRLAPVLGLLLTLAGVLAPSAAATVSVSRAEVSGSQLRLEGRALANRTITVDGVSMGTSDGSGSFKIQRSGYASPADCTVDVNDGSATPTSARLSGCTVTSSPTTPTLSSLALSPTSVGGGSSATGTVALTAAAPSGGMTVSLSSSNASAASVPASVDVPAGSTSATFTVTTGSVSADTSVTITAVGGGVSRSAVLTVTSSSLTTATLSSLALDPASVREGSTSTGTVTLSGPAPPGGVVVALSSGNAVATVPAQVTIVGGATTATFTITTGATAGTSSSVITASADGVSRTAILTVHSNNPTVSNLSLNPLSVVGGTSSTGTVTLTAPATPGGVVVSLSSGSAVATVPASVTVPENASTASFAIATSAVLVSTSALITASHGSASRSVTLTVTPSTAPPAVAAVALSATTVVGGTPVTGTVTLESAAPQGGKVVGLISDNTNAATVPASVTVAAGATRASFPVETKPVASSTSSTIVAEAGGARRGATITVTPEDTAPTITPHSAELGPGFVGADFTANSETTTTMTFGPNTLGPVRFEIIEGALPDGLSLVDPNAGFTPAKSIHASVAGVPTTVQTRTFTIRATDVNGLTATRTYTIVINPALPVAITPQQWAPLKVGEFGNLWIDGSGGVRPYTWAVTAGQLPTGMALIQDNPDGPLVRVGGTPTTAGTFSFTLRLTDAQGATVSRSFSVTVAPASEPALSSLALSPTTVTGGDSSTGTVTLDAAAPSGGASMALSSSNTAAATVPASVTVPAGATSATFTVSTTAVSSSASTTISATYAGLTRSATLTVNAPASSTDTVSISRAEYDSGKRVVRVEATSSGSGATLRAYVSATNELIGTLSAGRGEFSWPSNPQSITVRSSLGGSATRSVTAK